VDQLGHIPALLSPSETLKQLVQQKQAVLKLEPRNAVLEMELADRITSAGVAKEREDFLRGLANIEVWR